MTTRDELAERFAGIGMPAAIDLLQRAAKDVDWCEWLADQSYALADQLIERRKAPEAPPPIGKRLSVRAVNGLEKWAELPIDEAIPLARLVIARGDFWGTFCATRNCGEATWQEVAAYFGTEAPKL